MRKRQVFLLATVIMVALALRLAAIPLPNFENLMNSDHMHAWEPGNVAAALVAGRGFGSPFPSHQLSAVMPPVYPLIVAVLFKMFGVHTVTSIFAVHALNCLLSALACLPVFLIARRSFGERAGWWAAWAWACSPYGIYFAAAWAWHTHLLLLCLYWLLYLAQSMEHTPPSPSGWVSACWPDSRDSPSRPFWLWFHFSWRLDVGVSGAARNAGSCRALPPQWRWPPRCRLG